MNKVQNYVVGTMNQIQADTDYISGLLFEYECDFLQALLLLDPEDYELQGVSFNEYNAEVILLAHSTGRMLTDSVGLEKLTKWLVGIVG